jgi:hypothetical protein
MAWLGHAIHGLSFLRVWKSWMAGTRPAMTVKAGFTQGGSAIAGLCGTRDGRTNGRHRLA